MQPKCPFSLQSLQNWMGNLISSSFQPIASLSFSETECERFIAPSLKLRAHERVHIYHEQYWFRLFKTLHENFPSLIRLFGYHSFNYMIAIPYLAKYPSQEWSLSELGVKLPQWIQENYYEHDREIVEALSILDRAFTLSFSHVTKPPLSFEDIKDLEKTTLSLQPHVQLFNHPVNLFKFRDQILETTVEECQDHEFPELEQHECFTILFRNIQHQVVWKDLSSLEYRILKKFKKGSTLFTALENENDGLQILTKSFKEWTEQKLFFKSI